MVTQYHTGSKLKWLMLTRYEKIYVHTRFPRQHALKTYIKFNNVLFVYGVSINMANLPGHMIFHLNWIMPLKKTKKLYSFSSFPYHKPPMCHYNVYSSNEWQMGYRECKQGWSYRNDLKIYKYDHLLHKRERIENYLQRASIYYSKYLNNVFNHAILNISYLKLIKLTLRNPGIFQLQT